MTEYTNFEKAQSYAQLAEYVPDEQSELRHSTLAMAQVFATLAQIEAQRDAVSAVDHMTQTVEIGEGPHGELQGDTVVLREFQHWDSPTEENKQYNGGSVLAYAPTLWDSIDAARDKFPGLTYRLARFELLDG